MNKGRGHHPCSFFTHIFALFLLLLLPTSTTSFILRHLHTHTNTPKPNRCPPFTTLTTMATTQTQRKANTHTHTHTQPKKKAKILFVHGYLQNASTFRAKTGSVRKGLKSVCECVYVEAPFLAAPATEELVKAAGGVSVSVSEGGKEKGIEKEGGGEGEGGEGEVEQQQGKSWWEWTDILEDGSKQPRPSKALRYQRVDDGLRVLKKALTEHRPDGMFGFSQGATATALLLAELQREVQEEEENKKKEEGKEEGEGEGDLSLYLAKASLSNSSVPIQMPQFVILVGGFLPRDETWAQRLKHAQPRVKTLFVTGKTDQLVPPERSLALKDCFAHAPEEVAPEVLVHEGGHYVPSWKGEFKEEVKGFIERNFV